MIDPTAWVIGLIMALPTLACAQPKATLTECHGNSTQVNRYSCLSDEVTVDFLREATWCWSSPDGKKYELKSKYFQQQQFSAPEQPELSSDGEWIGWLQGHQLDDRFARCRQAEYQLYFTVQVVLLEPRTQRMHKVPLPAPLSTVAGEEGGQLRILYIDDGARQITLKFSRFGIGDLIYTVDLEGRMIREPAATGIDSFSGAIKHVKTGWIATGSPITKPSHNFGDKIAAWDLAGAKGVYTVSGAEYLKCGRVSGVNADPAGRYVAIQIAFNSRCVNPFTGPGVTHIIRVSDKKLLRSFDGRFREGSVVTFTGNTVSDGAKIIDLSTIR